RDRLPDIPQDWIVSERRGRQGVARTVTVDPQRAAAMLLALNRLVSAIVEKGKLQRPISDHRAHHAPEDLGEGGPVCKSGVSGGSQCGNVPLPDVRVCCDRPEALWRMGAAGRLHRFL